MRFTRPDDLRRYYPEAHDAIMAVKERLLSLMPAELGPLLEQLSEVQLRCFACDCAEHVLPFFERLMPQDQRPRLAIETARRFARGEAEAAVLKEAMGQAEGAAWKAGEVAGAQGDEAAGALPVDDAAASAAAAAEACCVANAQAAAQSAACGAVEVMLIAALGAQRADRVWAWQWHFATYDPDKLKDPAVLAAKVSQKLLDQYRQAEQQAHDWLMSRARAYLEQRSG